MEKIFKIILIYIPIVGIFSVWYFNTNIYTNKEGNKENLLTNSFIHNSSAIVQGAGTAIIFLFSLYLISGI